MKLRVKSPVRPYLTVLSALLSLASLLLPAQPVIAESKRYAVIVGINTYSRITPLNGCVNDARRMEKTARDRWGFTEANTKLLLNEKATRQGILKAFFNNLIQKCGKDDVALFYFSGHGTQMEDFSGDETDKADEVLCPQDMDVDDPSSGISDDTMQEYIKTLAEKCNNVIIIIDSCNSGTATLALGAGTTDEREIRNPRLQLAAASPDAMDSRFDQDRYPQNHVLLAACLPDETSKELKNVAGLGTSVISGVFTTHLLKEAEGKTLTEEIFLNVSNKVGSTVIQAGKSKQTPKLYGDLSLLSKLGAP